MHPFKGNIRNALHKKLKIRTNKLFAEDSIEDLTKLYEVPQPITIQN